MERLLEIEGDRLTSNFAENPFEVRHRLTEHDLLTVESLAVLADALPAESIEQNRGDVSAIVADGRAEAVDSTPGEIARGIETNGAWMVLKNIEQVPAYHSLLDELLDEVAPLVAGREGGMNLREGFAFLSAPNSTTPAHTDPEHNFLLQIRGTKHMNIGRFRDPAVEQKQVEKMLTVHRNMDRLPEDPTDYHLHPGQGVYVPPNAPHWVENGPDPSVSLSITFRTPVTERAHNVHGVNLRLRKLGINPRPPGQHLATDRVKVAALKAAGSLRRR